MYDFGEAMLALKAIKQYGDGLPAVVTLSPILPKETLDGIPYGDAARKLEESGADVVGMNCSRGPRTMMPLMKEIRQACRGTIAALSVIYRTSETYPVFQSFRDADTGKRDYPKYLQGWACPLSDIEHFAKDAREMGIRCVGLCCGNAPHYFRSLAMAYGRNPLAAKFFPDMSMHPANENCTPTDGMVRLKKAFQYAS